MGIEVVHGTRGTKGSTEMWYRGWYRDTHTHLLFIYNYIYNYIFFYFFYYFFYFYKFYLIYLFFYFFDPGMSLNCALTRVCRKSASRPGYVVKQCPRIVMNKIFDWH